MDDPGNAESRALAEQVVETLAAPETGPIARARTAIAVHLAGGGRAAPLARYRASTGGRSARSLEAPPRRASITALFALERAPEPEPAEDRATGEGGRAGGGGPLRARHQVRAHWKRQAFGPKHSRRRWIVVEGYTRGPAPEEDQILVTRLAQASLPARDDTDESD